MNNLIITSELNRRNISENLIKKIICFLLCVALFVYHVYDLNCFFIPLNGQDDVLYWTNAVFLATGKGMQVGKGNAYYSYGYSFVVAILIKIFNNPKVLYRAIIVVNVLFIVLSFLLLYRFLKKILDGYKNDIMLMVCSFAVSLNAANYVYSKFIFSECLITLLFICFINCFFDYITCRKISSLLFTSIICAYIHFVHQRTVGIIVSVICVLILMLIKKKISIKEFLIFLITFVALFMVGNWIKKYIVQNVYASASVSGDATSSGMGNDYKGVFANIIKRMKKKNVIYALFDFAAKTLYYNISTFFLGGVALCGMMKDVLCAIKKKEYEERTFLSILLLLVWLFEYSIAIVFMMGPKSNYEYIIYARYYEFIGSVYAIYGLCRIIKEGRISNAEVLAITFISFWGIYGINYQIIDGGMVYNHTPLNIGNMDFAFIHFKNLDRSLVYLSKIILILLINMILNKKRQLFIVTLTIFAVVSFYLNTSVHEDILVSNSKKQEWKLELAEFISSHDEESVLFLADNNFEVGSLQFLIPQKDVFRIKKEQIQEYSKMDHILLVKSNTNLIDTVNDYTFLTRVENILVYVHK